MQEGFCCTPRVSSRLFGLTAAARILYNIGKEAVFMNMTENSQWMLGLRAKGWTDTEIVNFCLWVGTGEEQYKPVEDDKK